MAIFLSGISSLDGEQEAAPNLCGRCGEDGFHVKMGDQYFLRVRRMTKCKDYSPGGRRTCKTHLWPTLKEAVAEWNAAQVGKEAEPTREEAEADFLHSNQFGWDQLASAYSSHRQRIAELEPQLAEANKKAEGWIKESESHRARAIHLENSRDVYETRARKAESRVAQLETALTAIHERARLGGGEAGLAGERTALLDIFTLAHEALAPGTEGGNGE